MFSTCNAQDTVFPLQTSQDGRYLEDSKGLPFLIVGDSAWSLIGDTSIPDAEFYLETRKRQGFNTVLVSLIEHQFSRKAPANFYDEKPFAGDAFEQPNEAYFDRAEAVIKAAASRNLLVLLCPAYSGARGGPEGWYQEMVAAGPEKLRAYGRYLGQRFAKYPNIIWVQGGDYDPPDRNLVMAVAMGIAETDPSALQTVHGNPDTVTSDFWRDASWLDIDSVYTYSNVAAAVLDRYRSGPRRPFFLIEGAYEGENDVKERQVRLIAYGALLSGASGQLFGNNPVWHFSAVGLYEAKDRLARFAEQPWCSKHHPSGLAFQTTGMVEARTRSGQLAEKRCGRIRGARQGRVFRRDLSRHSFRCDRSRQFGGRRENPSLV